MAKLDGSMDFAEAHELNDISEANSCKSIHNVLMQRPERTEELVASERSFPGD